MFFATIATAGNLLWYQTPADDWMKAIPTGNGRLSAMVYGGIKQERLALNEISMWSGQIDTLNCTSCTPERLAEMRKYFFAGDPEKGEELGNKYLNGSNRSFGTHLPLGDLVIDFAYPEGRFTDYRRELNLDNSVTAVTFKCGNINYRRELIADYPDNVIAMRITADKPGAVTATLGMNLLREAKVTTAGHSLTLGGKVNFPMHGAGGVNFCAEVRMVPEGGVVKVAGEKLTVTKANALTIIVDIRTDYNNKDYRNTCAKTVEKAAYTPFATMKQRHIADYTALFSRMSINLGDDTNANLPTDIRLKLAQEGAYDPAFDALFFQYGRYMLISSSRNHHIPLCANLQGLWNDNRACNMPWTCDYHLDINTQQNYWSANRANLAECNEPLFSYLQLLAEAGKVPARQMYGCRGWVAHTVCNAWGYSYPGWGVSWGMNVTGGAWLATHVWMHYLYTRDAEWLRTTGYPIIKGVAEFFMDYMVKDPSTGYLVTGPSISPENGYISKKGNHLSLAMMPTIDRDMVYDIYHACIESAKILKTDKKMRSRLEKDIKQLPPLMIGSDGQIQEWLDDVRRSDPSHRHSSHLLALFPLNQISYTANPDLIAAARKGLEIQTASSGWEDTEWSTANMLCFYARIKDAQVAYGWLQNLFNKFTRENLMTVSPAGVAMAEEDIFSFDATEASVAGICEMLLQSYDGFIEFLPALPKQWGTGEVKGICAEGGLVIDMKWENCKMLAATVTATVDCTFAVKGIAKKFTLKKGETTTIDFQ